MKKNKTKTGIEYLRSVYDKDYRCPLVFEAAEMLQMETMDEFSQWLADDGWIKSAYGSFWYNGKVNEKPNKLSEVYQMFLKSKYE
jgi:hypothetical protein